MPVVMKEKELESVCLFVLFVFLQYHGGSFLLEEKNRAG